MKNNTITLILTIAITTVFFTPSSLSEQNNIVTHDNDYGETVTVFMSRYCGLYRPQLIKHILRVPVCYQL